MPILDDLPLVERITNLAGTLSPKQHRLASYILANPLKAAFLTSTALAAEAGVSDSTVIRFAVLLGFEGYPQLQKELQRAFQDQVAQLDQYPLGQENEAVPLYRKVFALEASLLAATEEALCPRDFETAVDLLARARSVVVLGTPPSASVASYAAFFLGVLRPDVRLVTDLSVGSYTSLQDVGPDSVVLAFSFPRYAAQTSALAEHLHGKGVPIVVVTDSKLAPLATLASTLLVVPMRFISFVDPLAAPMALMHALLIGVFLKDPEHSRKQVKLFEHFWKENRLFLREDMDILGLL
ncbi:MurR/RpiR family transcriptional regulator [Aminomonas paucivorans]|uniref:MurR/RpiR family transcriptional regulator n=1 Tax=Aminomonas paucivorans TaxID=81412 RepID=UPI0033270429